MMVKIEARKDMGESKYRQGELLTHENSLSGVIERVTFHSEDTGYAVLRVDVRGMRDLATVVGTVGAVTPGEYVECEGEWIRDPSYGMQFKASSIRTARPATAEGMKRFLASGIIKGIGERYAELMVEKFGDQIFSVIENSPERLHEVPSIGKKRAESIVSGWSEQKAVREIMTFLASHGVGTATAHRIYKTYGDEAISVVTRNPYQLALDVRGIGFKTADDMALRMGVDRGSDIRMRAGVRHVLQELSENGHCASTYDMLTEKSIEMLCSTAEGVDTAINAEVDSGSMIPETGDNGLRLYLTPLYRAEQGVASNIARIMSTRTARPWAYNTPEEAMDAAERETGVELSVSQRNAVVLAFARKVLVVTGGPGTGKTTLVNSLLRMLKKQTKVVLCAPTGRAAKRMSETSGKYALTIHRLLEYDGRSGGPKRNRENPISADVVIVDEMSMVDVVLANQFLKALPSNCTLVMVGDVDQLPSVGPGLVLGDIIASGKVPTVRLNEVFRQAAESQIIVNAHRINKGHMPEQLSQNTDFYYIPVGDDDMNDLPARIVTAACEKVPQMFGYDPKRDVQVLLPMKRGSIGTHALNAALQTRLNDCASPKVTKFGLSYSPGDKVIQLVNDYDKLVFNGDIGLIHSMDEEDRSLEIDFDGHVVRYDMTEMDEITLAYATTVHKAQGSEYPCVVSAMTTQHYMMCQRNLLYTGVTRGRKLVILFGQPKAMHIAVKNTGSEKRLTGLAARIRESVCD